jgi:isoquinoline 1-oxidoreductase beta subunit
LDGKLISVDDRSALKIPGVIKIVRYEGTGAPMHIRAGVAVIAVNTWTAIKARKLLKIVWDEGTSTIKKTLQHF